MSIQFRNLVFEGGGVKGIAYVGALGVLEREGLLKHLTRVGGTSAGAINALLVALGYPNKEQLDLLSSLDFNDFKDNSFGILRDVLRTYRSYGWNKGDFFSGWIGKAIKGSLGNEKATFADIQKKRKLQLYMIGTNLSTGYAEVFSAERHPDMPLANAVRISMSIPLFFAAIKHGPRSDVYVDGGVQLNFPVKLFDREKYIAEGEDYAIRRTEYYEEENEAFSRKVPGRSPYIYNRQTLGFRLDSKEEIGLFRYDEPLKGAPIRKFKDYATALFTALMNSQEHIHLHGDDWQRTVYIDTLDIGTVDFNLSEHKKEQLLQQGAAGVEAYLKWFQNPDEKPVNRILPVGMA